MNEIIQIREWQLIISYLFVAIEGGLFVMFIMPRIEKWLIKFNKDLEEFIGDKK